MNQITNKLGSHIHDLSPAMQDVIQRVRQTGLHKVAAQLRGKPEFTLRDGVQELAFKLAYTHLRNQKIASGMHSFAELERAGVIKTSSMSRINRLSGTTQSLLGKAEAGAATKAVPANLPASHAGISLPTPKPGRVSGVPKRPTLMQQPGSAPDMRALPAPPPKPSVPPTDMRVSTLTRYRPGIENVPMRELRSTPVPQQASFFR